MARRPPTPNVAQLGDRSNCVVLQGIYRAWQTSAAATDHDPFATIEDIERYAATPGGIEAAREAARAAADAEARVAAGQPIPQTLLRPLATVGPWWYRAEQMVQVPRTPFFKADVLYRIGSDDVVEVNAEATRAYRQRQVETEQRRWEAMRIAQAAAAEAEVQRRAEEQARRLHVAEPVSTNGHNGSVPEV